MLLYTHAKCLDHEVPPGHPERPDRLRAVLQHLEATGLLADFDVREPGPATTAALSQIHRLDYLNTLTQLAPDSGLMALDPDTAIGPRSLDAAALAAGAVADAVRALLNGESKRAFCAVRPPGHHAEAGHAMGFCVYNNVALGAVTALTDPEVTRVAILDFDVHHGNGTVDIFKDRPEVLVCSSFQYPFYPNRYTDLERDNIVNTPLPAGTGGDDFRAAIERDWLPALERHQPQLILVSAGFDAHRLDPLAQLALDDADFRWLTELIVDQAEAYAGGRVASTLEGGYDLTALAQSVATHTAVLLRG